MEKKVRKELIVSAIENGTVIDHIPSNKVFDVINILELDKYDNELLFGTNLDSKKYGKKGIIKVKDKYFAAEEINKIALAAPIASLIVIKDFAVIEKKNVEVPDEVCNFVRCFNPKCITNHQDIPTRFEVIDKENTTLLCHYCEKTTKKENIEFIK